MKISLKNLNLREVERLTREQLKDVFGGGNQEVQTTNKDCGCGCFASHSSCQNQTQMSLSECLDYICSMCCR